MATLTTMPYDSIKINDLSEYSENTASQINAVPSGPILFCPFISEKGYGDDNEPLYMDSSILEKYGKPNYNKYGLSLYIARQFAAGGGTVLGMRCTDVGTSGLIAPISAISCKDLNSNTIVNGTSSSYVFSIECRAKGAFGNNYSYTFEKDVPMNNLAVSNEWKTDATHYVKFYKFTLTYNDQQVGDTVSLTFADGFSYENESLYVNDVFGTHFPELAFTFNAMVSNSSYLYTNDAILDNVSGDLSSGSDGGFTMPYDGQTDKYAAIIAAAYTGAITNKLSDQNRYPFNYIIAPSADTSVTKAIHNLVGSRDFTFAKYFTKAASYSAATTEKATLIASPSDAVWTWKESVTAEWATIKDPYTFKRLKVPFSYFDAYNMPNHWLTAKGKPYAGIKNYVYNGFILGTVTPVATKNNYSWNHNAQLNTILEDGNGNATMYEQLTAQAASTALSEMNNALILCEMIRISLETAENSRWTDLGDEDINSYKDRLRENIDAKLGSTYNTLEIVTKRESANGAGRNRIYCKLMVTFKNMLKGVSHEFYILAN